MNNQKRPIEELDWEDAVSRYLEEDPGYFMRHPDVLLALQLPHPERGQAVSLLERQIDLLRQRYATTAEQLRELVHMARENDSIAERVHRFALALIDCRSQEEITETARGLLRQEFGLDAVSILREPGSLDGAAERFSSLWERCQGQPLCGPELEPEALQLLFGRAMTQAHSTAVIPLTSAPERAFLALASEDPHRFHRGMGTVYLVRLGELLGRSLSQNPAAP